MVVDSIRVNQAGSQAARSIEDTFGARVALCYQCKRCTAGCPVADSMDLRPHQIVRMVQLGATDRALASDAIWTCVGCYTCTARCPQEVPVTDIIYSMKSQAMRHDLPSNHPTVPAFVNAFTGVVERHGRSREPEMLARYYLSTGPRAALEHFSMGLKLIRQGRLPLLGHRLPGWKSMRSILQKTRRTGGAE